MTKNLSYNKGVNEQLTNRIDDLIEHLEYPLDYSQSIKYFIKAEGIIQEIRNLSTVNQFPYLLSLMDLKKYKANEDFFEFYLEIKEMFYDGIYDGEKIYLDWFWEQFSHPAACDDDLWDIFYELFDTETVIPLLKDMLINTTDKEDKKVLREALYSCTV